MLVVQDARVVRLSIELVLIPEFPVDACLVLPDPRGKILSLVHESLSSVSTKELSKVEAVGYDWYASCSEGQGPV
jgi:hypothetical protein